jgi:hypothetical protein
MRLTEHEQLLQATVDESDSGAHRFSVSVDGYEVVNVSLGDDILNGVHIVAERHDHAFVLAVRGANGGQQFAPAKLGIFEIDQDERYMIRRRQAPGDAVARGHDDLVTNRAQLIANRPADPDIRFEEMNAHSEAISSAAEAMAAAPEWVSCHSSFFVRRPVWQSWR